MSRGVMVARKRLGWVIVYGLVCAAEFFLTKLKRFVEERIAPPKAPVPPKGAPDAG